MESPVSGFRTPTPSNQDSLSPVLCLAPSRAHLKHRKRKFDLISVPPDFDVFDDDSKFSDPISVPPDFVAFDDDSKFSDSQKLLDVISVVQTLFMKDLNNWKTTPDAKNAEWDKQVRILRSMRRVSRVLDNQWHLWDRKTPLKEIAREQKNTDGVQCNASATHKGSSDESFVKSIKYGQRPDVKEIFKPWKEQQSGVPFQQPQFRPEFTLMANTEGRKTEEMMLTGGEKTNGTKCKNGKSTMLGDIF